MATYVIVDKDKDPLDPGEVNAGGTIQVADGDIFIIDATANANITFEAASGSSTDLEIRFEDDNSENFNLDINADLNPTILISDDVELPDVEIKAQDAESVVLTVGDDVTLEGFEGSDTGTDTVNIGDNFTTTKDFKTGGGDDSITIGDGATMLDIETGAGDDTITIGDGAVVDDIKTGDGDDTIVIGDDFTGDKIETKDGDDAITIGDGAVVDDIKTDKGDDSVIIGDDFTGDKIETKDGYDFVSIGDDADVNKVDGGNGNDRLATSSDIPGASNFETVVCFTRGTMILTPKGELPIEALRVGDKVSTLDNKRQTIRWIGSSEVAGHGPLAPVCIAKGALGNCRDLWVSQQHRMLVADWRTELLFGESETLVAAKHLVDGETIRLIETDSVEYFHILFDRHELVFAEGICSESFHPGQVGLQSLQDDARDEIFRIFPSLQEEWVSHGPLARPCLRAFEGALLAA